MLFHSHLCLPACTFTLISIQILWQKCKSNSPFVCTALFWCCTDQEPGSSWHLQESPTPSLVVQLGQTKWVFNLAKQELVALRKALLLPGTEPISLLAAATAALARAWAQPLPAAGCICGYLFHPFSAAAQLEMQDNTQNNGALLTMQLLLQELNPKWETGVSGADSWGGHGKSYGHSADIKRTITHWLMAIYFLRATLAVFCLKFWWPYVFQGGTALSSVCKLCYNWNWIFMKSMWNMITH